MNNLTQDRKLSETSKQDHVSETYTVESAKKFDNIKKKSEKSRKDDGNRDEHDNSSLTAIGRSVCGRWVKFRQSLGEGGYKTVFKGYDSEKGKNVAWCEFKPHHVDTKEKQVNIMKEIEIMVKMDHPNIVICYDVFDEYIDLRNLNNPINIKSIILIQELLGEGTLKSVIKKNFINGELILEFSLILYWFHQIIDALAYMHEKLNPPIIHRDLKADNCFLESKSSDKYLNVKVGDFGLATQVSNKERNTMLGTVGFMAPEVYDEKYDIKVDIYAFGMLMLEVLTNRTPYDDCETVMQVAKHTMSGRLPDIFTLVSDPWTREMISCCIHPLPIYRPTAMELLYHPLFIPSYKYKSKNILPVEITPNSDKCTDRETIIKDFIENIVMDNSVFQTKFNLRMEFRNKKIQRSFGLDESESLEFDLDVFKDEDVPELISNLKSEYEENLREELIANKSSDAKSVNTQLEKFFKSMELQMKFIMKMLLGKRWHFILEGLLSKQNDTDVKGAAYYIKLLLYYLTKIQNFIYDITGFSLLANYKKNWLKATKQLENEILNYQKQERNSDSVKISKIFKASEMEKLDSITEIQEKNLAFDFLQSQTGNIDKPIEDVIFQKPKDYSEGLNSAPNYDNMMFNQPNPYQYNNMPLMNPVVYPSENTTFTWQNLNSGKPAVTVANNIGKIHENSISTVDLKQNVKAPAMPRASTKSKVNSLSDKTNKKQRKESYIDKIFTLEEVMKYIVSKSHRNSKSPFVIIPVKGQSNAFYLLKINDSKMDSQTSEDSLSKKDEYVSSKLNSLPLREVSNKTFNNPLESNSAKPNSFSPFQNDMFILPSFLPNSSSNLSVENITNYSQYNMMNFWIQQQNFFQQQLFQQQQQQLLLQQQQQQIQYQQQLQRRIHAQQQMMKKNTLQLKQTNSFDFYNMVPPINELPEKMEDNYQSSSVQNESLLSKFMVRKIEEPTLNIAQFSNKTDSPTLSLEDDRLKEHQNKEKTPKEKRNSSNKAKENHCNLEHLNDKIFPNSQGEYDLCKQQPVKIDEDKGLFSKINLQTSNDPFPFNNNPVNHSCGTNNTAISTSKLFKSPSNISRKSSYKNKNDINSAKFSSTMKELNGSTTYDFSDSGN